MKNLNIKNKFRKLFLLSQSILLTSQVYGNPTLVLDPEYEFENIKLSNETKKIEEQIKFYHLPVEDWPKLYNNLRAKSKQKNFNYLNRIAFNLRDFMIRMASFDNNILKILSEKYQNQNYEFSLKKQFENLNFKNSRFHLLKDKSGKSFRFLDNAIIDKNGSSTFSKKSPKTLVLHGAFEAPNIRVGGVGAVLADMINAENTHISKKIEARILTPFYDVFKDTFSDAEFIGFIDHEVDYLSYKSSIYQVKHANYKQYFLQPDPNFHVSNIYDIGENSKLYNYFSNESWLYYSSGLAHFSALFKGKHNLKNIDVIQVNDWHLCFTPAILELRLNPLRQAVNLPSISTVATTHEHVDNKFTDGSLLYNRVGLPRPKYSDLINLQILFQLHSNISNAVSKGVADEMCDPQNGLNMGHVFKFLRGIDRFRGITNGVSSQNFDVTNTNVFKSLTVKNDLSDLNERKRQAKQILFEEGLIGDPNKPLFLYVGRYSSEKGIDVLPSFADFVIANNSQMVTMGIVVDPHVNYYLQALENKNNTNTCKLLFTSFRK